MINTHSPEKSLRCCDSQTPEGGVLYDRQWRWSNSDRRRKQFGLRGEHREDPKWYRSGSERAQPGVSELVRFRNEDMFRIDVSEATVVTLYLSEKLNVLLRPKLLRELRPGSRILSHDFRMGDWKPEQTVRIPWGNLYRTVYLWTVPTRSSAKRRAT